jgi:hypothetical protein
MDPRTPDSAAHQPMQAPSVPPTVAHPGPGALREVDPSELADDATPLAGRPVMAVQQWLDGEASEESARRAEPRETALWGQINDETDRRARMMTPAPVKEGIMAAIQQAPAAPVDAGLLGKIGKLFKR